MFEDIILKLVGVAVSKIADEVSKRFSRLKKETEEIEGAEKQQKLKRTIEESEKELGEIKERIISEVAEAVSKVVERSFDISKIRPAFERANAKCKPNVTVDEMREISVELGHVYIREIMSRLGEPLKLSVDDRHSELVNEINEVAKQMASLYETSSKRSWDPGGIANFLTYCNELDFKVITLVKERMKYA